MRRALVSRRLVYALYMAAFGTAETATFAAFYASHLFYFDLLRYWLSGFLILLIGAYAGAGIRSPVGRAVVVAAAGGLAWTYFAISAFGPYGPDFREIVREAIELRFFFLVNGAQVLLLALGAELSLKLTARIVAHAGKTKPLPVKGGVS